MDTQIKNFLSNNKIAALTTLLPDGMPHSAAIHFSHGDSPFELYFSTDKTSRKCEGLVNGETVKSSVVIGFSTQEWITFQLSGEITIITNPAELQKVQEIHYAKHPHSAKYKDDPATVFLKFTPKWWRFTDFNTDPVTKIYS